VRRSWVALFLVCLCAGLPACAKKAVKPRITLESTIVREDKARSGLDSLRKAVRGLQRRGQQQPVEARSSAVPGEQVVGTTGNRDTSALSARLDGSPASSAEPSAGRRERLTTEVPVGRNGERANTFKWFLALAAVGIAVALIVRRTITARA
jgi:hypothetical protein